MAIMVQMPAPLDSRLRGNDEVVGAGVTVSIPLAPLRSAKGGDSSLRFGMT